MLSATVDRYLEVIFNHFSFYLVPITRCWTPKALTIIPFDYYLFLFFASVYKFKMAEERGDFWNNC